jgi:hypothetical protein
MTSAVVVGRCAVSAGAVAFAPWAAASRVTSSAGGDVVIAAWAAAMGEVAAEGPATVVAELRVDAERVEGGTASDACAAAADITAGPATADVAAVINASTASRTVAKVFFTFNQPP